MLSDKLRESLIQSSKKIAVEIALLTKEKKTLEEELWEFENKVTMAEAKIEVHKDKRDAIHRELAAKKSEKNEYYAERDKLIDKKRLLQDELRNIPRDMDASELKDKISELSDQIGEVIERSKDLSEQMQQQYNESQVEHHAMLDAIEESKKLKYESDKIILGYKKKIAELDIELNKSREKMSQINEKLDE